MKTIIIGAVAAGMSTAAKLKRLDKQATITVYEKGHDISYGACGMPYFLGDIIKQEESLSIKTVEDFKQQGIDVLINHEVITVVPETKTITVFQHDTGRIMTDTYDHLVIATGASAKRTFVSGSHMDKIHVLKHLDDVRQLKRVVSQVETVAIIGGGYIGIEVAENLAELGKDVVLIESGDQILSFLDYDISKQVELELESLGVTVQLRERLESYQQDNEGIIVHTNMSKYPVDLVIEAIGIQPNTAFLKELRFDMLPNGAIKVNKYLETNSKDIYAAGDCAAYFSEFMDDYVYVPLATHAVKAGKCIAENIAGQRSEMGDILGSTVIKVGKLCIAKTGLSLEDAQAKQLDVGFVDVQAHTKASYYPGGTEIMIRIVYESETGILIGAEIISEKDINSDINMMALAISNRMTAMEFSKIDFAYSPPFSGVHNPFQIATKKINV